MKTKTKQEIMEEMLFESVKRGNVEGVEKLLALDVNVNVHRKLLRIGKDMSEIIEGPTPLHWAIEERHTEIAKVLIKGGANLEAKDDYGWTPLYKAIMEGQTELAKMLIKAGAELNVQYEDKLTPLHLVAEEGNTELAKALIDAGAYLDVQDEHERTALNVAGQNDHTAIAKALIDAGADLNIFDELCESKVGIMVQKEIQRREESIRAKILAQMQAI